MFNSYRAKICAASLYANEFKRFSSTRLPKELRNGYAELVFASAPCKRPLGGLSCGGHSVPDAGVDWLLFFYYKLLRVNMMQPAVFQRLRRAP